MYDYFEELEQLHRVQNQRYNRKGEMSYGSWQFESWGLCLLCLFYHEQHLRRVCGKQGLR